MDIDNMKKQISDAFDRESGATKVILTCSCFRMDKKAVEAFKMLFPGQEVPEVIKGRDRIFKFAETTDNAHIKAISKLSGKFAYYVEMDGDNILEEYNLVTGRRIA